MPIVARRWNLQVLTVSGPRFLELVGGILHRVHERPAIGQVDRVAVTEVQV